MFQFQPMRDHLGATYQWLCTATDVDDAKTLEVDLRTAERHSDENLRFQSDLLAAAGQAIVAVDLDRKLIYWNRAAEEMYGWSSAEAMGRYSFELIIRVESPERAELLIATVLRGERWSGDYEVTRRMEHDLGVRHQHPDLR